MSIFWSQKFATLLYKKSQGVFSYNLAFLNEKTLRRRTLSLKCISTSITSLVSTDCKFAHELFGFSQTSFSRKQKNVCLLLYLS